MDGGKLHPLRKVLVSFLTFLLLATCFENVSSKIAKGSVSTTATLKNWVFLTRFCFLSDKGRLEFKLSYPVSYGVQNILLYYDTPTQWPAVYGTDKSCLEKEAVLDPGNNQVINLTTSYTWAGCKIVGRGESARYECGGGRTFKSSRERWWFIALDNCASTKGLKLDYELTMTNAPLENFFFAHFSADEFYILQIDISFVVIYAMLFCMSCGVAVILRGRQLLHITYKMYMGSLACELIANFFFCVYYGDYGRTGIPLNGLKYMARFFEALSILIFLLMLILVGKGYTITRGRLSTSGTIKIAVFMTVYVIVYIVLFICEAELFDPGLVLYLYESVPGYGLIGMRLIGWLWFCYAIFFTLKHYPEKNKFYYPLFVFYSIWFWAGPIVIFVANEAVSLWVREKVVHGVERTVAFCGHLVLLILTRPTAANDNFPYHVRTTQIGIMQGQGGPVNGNFPMNDREDFAAHTYAVSAPPNVQQYNNFETGGNGNAAYLAANAVPPNYSFSQSNGGHSVPAGTTALPNYSFAQSNGNGVTTNGGGGYGVVANQQYAPTKGNMFQTDD